MKTCEKCGIEFKSWIKINGVLKNITNRKFCLTCSPWGRHNTRNLNNDILIESRCKKICSKCKIEMPLSDFYKRRRSPSDLDVSPYCKACMNKYTTDRGRQLKVEAIAYKGGKCEMCGYNKCNRALEFHHIDPNDKKFQISHFKNTTIEKLKPELNKCTLLCANCHREVEDNLYPQLDLNQRPTA